MHKVGIVFPGQGSQYVGMGKDLYDEFVEVKNIFDEAREILMLDIVETCFKGPREILDSTVFTQTAVLTLNIAAYKLFEKEIGIPPMALAGHSVGEYAALHVAGAMNFTDVLSLVHARAHYQNEAVPPGEGCMAAIIGIKKTLIEDICRDISNEKNTVAPAGFNEPRQIVISGTVPAVEEAMKKAMEFGAQKVVKLSVSVPCHCSLMNDAAKRFNEDLEHVEINDFGINVIPNIAPDIFHSKHSARESLVRQINSAVRWQETIEKMAQMGIDTIVEIGPQRILSNLVKKIDKNIQTLNIGNLTSLRKTINFFSNS